MPFRTLARLNRMYVQVGSDEHEHQAALVQWVRETSLLQSDETKREALRWFHAIPNGGGRGRPFITKTGRRLPPLEAVNMKAEGVTPGISDLRLDYVVYRNEGNIAYAGLVAEMKRAGQRLRPEQASYQQFMLRQHVCCRVWYTWQEAALDIAEYMFLEKIAPVYVQIPPDRILTANDRHDLKQLLRKFK